MALALVLAAPAAQAAVTTQLDIGAQLLDQPPGRPWAVNLQIGARMTEPTGPEFLPPTRRLVFQFPKATVNAGRFPVCRAAEQAFRRLGPSACPRSTVIGEGAAEVRALRLPFGATLTIYNGPGDSRTRKLKIWAVAKGDIEVQVYLEGVLTKIDSGNYGFRFELPIPDIQVLAGEIVSIEAFQVTVGKRITRRGRKISYLEAPRRCPDPGWPFLFRDELQNGETPTDTRLISCVIRAR